MAKRSLPSGSGPKVQLPRDALSRVRVGASFAEYDLVRDEPSLFVLTPAVEDAVKDGSGFKCLFVGRRGTGKTATTYYLTRQRRGATQLHPQIFDLGGVSIDAEQHRDTRQRPFRTLMLAFQRALFTEAIAVWIQRGTVKAATLPSLVARERGLLDMSFDERFLAYLDELQGALQKERDWLKLTKRITKELPDAVREVAAVADRDAVLLLDRIDEAWNGKEEAVILLAALMHACVEVVSKCPRVQPKLFVRENIFERVRSVDNEFARLETSVVSMDWSREQLLELVERRLNLPFNTKLPLHGPTWDHFFVSESGLSTADMVFGYCQHRPRDVILYCSFAIECALSHSRERVSTTDLTEARRRFSESRLKDLGDEYSENYPSIDLVLSRFFGLGTEYTFNGMADFVGKLLVDDSVKRHCARWIYKSSDVETFVHILFAIGFIGVSDGSRIIYRSLGAKASVTPPLSTKTRLVVHPSYVDALALQDKIIGSLAESTRLGESQVVPELPEALNLDDYKDRLSTLLEDLRTLPQGNDAAPRYEDLVGEIIKLCFFRSLANVQPQQTTSDLRVRRDWIASNRATTGFWERIRARYGAHQVLWECKNYDDLKPADFNQFAASMTKPVGGFLICSFRGAVKDYYYEHIRRILNNRSSSAIVLLLTDSDLQVFLRQAMHGKIKEDHIEDIHDRFVRKVS